MNTKIIRLDEENLNMKAIREGAEIIKRGGLVIFPTETVYGIGANALSAEACAGIFRAKGRPSDNPLIVTISDLTMLADCIAGPVEKKTKALMDHFWPGPLTIILKKSSQIPLEVTAGLDTVALRYPDSPIPIALIQAAGVPVAAPSGNLSGKPSPTTVEHVIKDMEGRVDLILGGKDCAVGVESTIIDMTAEVPTVLRPGGVTLEELRKVLPDVVLDRGLVSEEETPKAPGMKYTHYAPTAPLYLVEGPMELVVEKINALVQAAEIEGKNVGILCCDETKDRYCASNIIRMGTKAHPETIAAELFKALRTFDDIGVDVIYSEVIDEREMGLAVMNRMKKAAGFKIITVR